MVVASLLHIWLYQCVQPNLYLCLRLLKKVPHVNSSLSRRINCNCNSTFIVLNLHHTIESKLLHPIQVQCRCPLSICLIAVAGNQSTRSKPTLKKSSGNNPHMSVKTHWWNSSGHCRHWELSVLPKDTK